MSTTFSPAQLQDRRRYTSLSSCVERNKGLFSVLEIDPDRVGRLPGMYLTSNGCQFFVNKIKFSRQSSHENFSLECPAIRHIQILHKAAYCSKPEVFSMKQQRDRFTQHNEKRQLKSFPLRKHAAKRCDPDEKSCEN